MRNSAKSCKMYIMRNYKWISTHLFGALIKFKFGALDSALGPRPVFNNFPNLYFFVFRTIWENVAMKPVNILSKRKGIWIIMYSGDLKNEHLNNEHLNNEHLNNGNIWVTNFHLSGIQMSGIQMVVRYSDHHANTGPVFKWWSEYWTKFSRVFKWHSNNGSFGDRTIFDHLNTRLVRYSDPHCCVLWEISSLSGNKSSQPNSYRRPNPEDWINRNQMT